MLKRYLENTTSSAVVLLFANPCFGVSQFSLTALKKFHDAPYETTLLIELAVFLLPLATMNPNVSNTQALDCLYNIALNSTRMALNSGCSQINDIQTWQHFLVLSL